MNSASATLPKQFVWTVIALTTLPALFNLCGIGFGSHVSTLHVSEIIARPGTAAPGVLPDSVETKVEPAKDEPPKFEPMYYLSKKGIFLKLEAERNKMGQLQRTLYLEPSYFVKNPEALADMLGDKRELDVRTPSFYLANQGVFVHTILEWSAFSIALVTVVISFIHYNVKHDVTTPIIGSALFFSGMIDAFNTLAADRLIGNVADYAQFVPFTWAISRTFNVCIMIVGTGLFLYRGRAGIARTKQRGMRFVILVGILFGLLAYLIIISCALIPPLPQEPYSSKIMPRPWDAIPLVLFLLAGGIIFPRFHRMYPSQFSHGLIVSVVPHTTAQLFAAFGSTALYDNGFNVAYYLKIIAYIVPLAGLLLDYVRAYHSEATLRATEEQLRIAREVQLGLFPKDAPRLPGYDIYGVSYPAEATGGDYFDYFPMEGASWAIIVADVSGHDMGAALLMAQTRAYLRALAHQQVDLSQMITYLNNFLVEDLHDKRFVSMFFAELNPSTNVFNFAAAGHYAFILHPSATVKKLEATSPLLGVNEDLRIPCGKSEALMDGDVVVFLTDGIIEAESREGIPFGLQRALAVVSVNREKSAKEIVELLTQSVKRHCRNLEQKDDLTIVILKKVPTR